MSSAFPEAPMCTGCAASRWAQMEAPFSANGYQGARPAGALRAVDGRREVLLTAPNSVNYYRGDYQHKAARWTGSCVEAVALATGLSSLAMAGPPRQVPYRDNPEYAFADRLRGTVDQDTFVLDVIGMRDRQIDICLGMGPAPDYRSEAVAARLDRGFTARGVRVARNQPFPALAAVTVTAYTQLHLGGSALQLGIGAWLRDPSGSPTMAKLVLDVIRDALGEAA